MSSEYIQKCRLPACTIHAELLHELWNIFGKDDNFVWRAVIGNGNDFLGKEDMLENRPHRSVIEWTELLAELEITPRIDHLCIGVEIAGKGMINITFKNFTSPMAQLIVKGIEEKWVNERFIAIQELFATCKEQFATVLYSWLGFGVVQTAIPLSISFILVMFLAGTFIPAAIRRSEWIWWITAGTVVVTLRLAYTLSNRLIIYTLKKYHYIKYVQ